MDLEHRTAVGVVAGEDLALVRGHDLAADRQAQAGAARAVLGAAGLHEGLEDGLQLVARDARPVVAHGQPQTVGFVAPVDVDLAARGREADRVGQHVAQHLLQTDLIGPGPQRAIGTRVTRRHQLQRPGGRQVPQLGHHRPQRGHDVDRLQRDLADGGFQPRQVEQVVDQAQHALAGAVDVAEHALQPGLGAGAQRAQLREPQDRLQRRAQFVADVGQKLALGGVGALGRLLGLQRALGRFAELGHVHQAADHTGDLAVDVGVGHQADHHVARQAVAVEHLLLVGHRLARGHGHLLLHLVRRGQLRGVHPAHVAAHQPVGLHAGEVGPGLVDAQKAAVGVLDHHRDRADLEQAVGEGVLRRHRAPCGLQVTADHFMAAQAAPGQRGQRAQQPQQRGGAGDHVQRDRLQLVVQQGLGRFEQQHHRVAAQGAVGGEDRIAVDAGAHGLAVLAAGTQVLGEHRVPDQSIAGLALAAFGGHQQLAAIRHQRSAQRGVVQQQAVLVGEVAGVQAGDQPVAVGPGRQRPHQRQQIGRRRVGAGADPAGGLTGQIGQIGQITSRQQRPQAGGQARGQQGLTADHPAHIGRRRTGQHPSAAVDQADAAQEGQGLHRLLQQR